MGSSPVYDLGPVPRPPVVRFLYDSGVASAFYALEADVTEISIPDGVIALEIYQLPVYPQDHPAGDDPGWGLNAARIPDLIQGPTRIEVHSLRGGK